METKHCGGCDRDLNYSCFHKSARRKDGLSTQCKECANARGKAWYAANKDRRDHLSSEWYATNRDRVINNNLKRKYGITLDEYNEMLVAQGYVCAVCGETESRIEKRTGRPYALAVDHCHESSKVRGLLCRACNYTIGYFGDNLEGAKRLVEYLEGKICVLTLQ